MKHFVPTTKNNTKQKIKRILRRMIETFYLPPKDRGKKQYYHFLSMPVKDTFIFYEAFSGLGILDNPRAVFLYFLSYPAFAGFTHVWSVENIPRAADNIKEFSNLPNVIIVKKDSGDYYRYLATCKYLISNSTFGYYFQKREEQTYINTWHGVPTKYMGYDHSVESVENGRGPARNFLMADYIISYNHFMTETMYKKAYKLDGVFRGKILECGNPRSDLLFHTKRDEICQKLNKAGIPTDKKIILYAPTWKGNLYNQLQYNIEEFKITIQKFSENIDSSKYNIFLRVHYFLYKVLSQDEEFSRLLIPFTIDTNELLSVTDILISDYSSIFFDFLCTKRPILFYVPDLLEYQSGRGLYVPVEKLPGLVSSNIDTVSQMLRQLCDNQDDYVNQYEELYYQMRSWCNVHDDGQVCERLTDILLSKDSCPDTSVDKNIPSHLQLSLTNEKKKRLICFHTKLNTKPDYDMLKTIRYYACRYRF